MSGRGGEVVEDTVMWLMSASLSLVGGGRPCSVGRGSLMDSLPSRALPSATSWAVLSATLLSTGLARRKEECWNQGFGQD